MVNVEKGDIKVAD